MIKKLLLILSIFFTTLTFIGAIYVFNSNGTTNARYAVIPMVFTLIFVNGYRTYKEKDDK